MSLSIPQTDPGANYRAHREEIDDAVRRVLASGWYVLGREVAAFEEEFAAFLGAPRAVSVASGTDALCLALRACGVGRGDCVLTVSHTAVATVAAIDLCGAVPVFVDIDPKSFTMDPDCLDETIRRLPGRPYRAVVPVHLYGHPADMGGIARIAGRYGLRVVEDCAQSHGALWGGRRTGTLGDIAAFSFYPTKNLGALGDGGMVATGDSGLAERVRLLREYGWKERYISSIAGTNSRLDELQAAVLRVKLRYLDGENARRRKIADLYSASLAGTRISLPVAAPGATPVYHQYVIRTEGRDDLKAYLGKNGVGTLIHYPVPVHLQPAYREYAAGEARLPHTEVAAGKILSLPMYPELGDEQARAVARHIEGWREGR